MTCRLLARVGAVLLAMLLVCGASDVAFAQQQPAGGPPATAPKSFLPPAAKSGAAPSPTAATAPSGLYGWVSSVQHGYNQKLARAIRDLKTGNPWMAVLVLAGLSFTYGVLHAAGPGHGKAVISSYVLASEQTVRRGIALSFLAALFQAVSALVLVAVLVFGLKATGLEIKATEAWLETLSWALVAVIGAWLLWRQIKEWRADRAVSHAHHDHGPHAHHGHAHHHGHGHLHGHGHGHSHSPAHGHHHAHDHHNHDRVAHDACEVCGHAHMPDPKQLEGAWSWSKALALAAAIGIRPCTGAILVLVFAIGQGLAWAGVFATFAMALGTAITVSALAALAIGSRELAARFGKEGSGWATGVRRLAGVGGSLAVMVLGGLLFVGSLGPSAGL